MYLIKVVTETDVVAEAIRRPPFGPEFTPKQAGAADKMEVWGSSFDDPGPDFCEFRLLQANQIVATKRVAGY